MIQQTNKGLNSRSEANPYNEDGFLPLITAPMYSVVNETNYQTFLDNKIQVCLPRNVDYNLQSNNAFFIAYSLQEFQDEFINNRQRSLGEIKKVCIDTANGNIPALHDAIRKAKEIHGGNLIIMAGNVSSVEAFVELAKTGVDYIRVGIGGGGGCNTTSNTGVGQEDLGELIKDCYNYKTNYPTFLRGHELIDKKQIFNINNVKIIADGISSYIKQCETKYGFNDNGYAAINKLLFAGADLVMVGKLFAQCVESAGEKGIDQVEGVIPFEQWQKKRDSYIQINLPDLSTPLKYFTNSSKRYSSYLMVKYSGMSTQEEQRKYKPAVQDLKILSGPQIESDTFTYEVEKQGEPYKDIKPSEGSVQWIPVRWTLNEWLNGSNKQDEAPYLMGWINSIKSAMSYTGKTKL